MSDTQEQGHDGDFVQSLERGLSVIRAFDGEYDAPLRLGVPSAIGTGVLFPLAFLSHNPTWTVALICPALFCLALPMGTAVAALQMIFPNQVRGQVSAFYLSPSWPPGYFWDQPPPRLNPHRRLHNRSHCRNPPPILHSQSRKFCNKCNPDPSKTARRSNQTAQRGAFAKRIRRTVWLRVCWTLSRNFLVPPPRKLVCLRGGTSPRMKPSRFAS